MCYTKEGKFYTNSDLSNADLIFAPEKHEGWINIYKTKESWSSSYNIWPTKEEAKKVIGGGYITTVKIEWEE